jgi:bifunctional DNA-binding transcriptional regulator/antitoxin component of YhaV-PrlF toxin-antitoxin module
MNARHMSLRRRGLPAAIIPALIVACAACDVMTADLKHTETAEWRKTFELAPGGRVEIGNVNGRIVVEPSAGNAVEVVALKTARAATSEAAKAALERTEIRDEATRELVRVTTKVASEQGWFGRGGVQVQYNVRLPAAAAAALTTVNGGVELTGLGGTITAQTTNGGVIARNVSGAIDASTTNGGVEVDLATVAEGGAKLSCTNGGIVLRLPRDARASISAAITNGGIDASGLSLETTESSRRRLVGRLNGGGPAIRLEGTNGGITIGGR